MGIYSYRKPYAADVIRRFLISSLELLVLGFQTRWSKVHALYISDIDLRGQEPISGGWAQ